MSHNPTMNYGYAPRQNYYMEEPEPEPEPEDYGVEYSDSEGIVENPPIIPRVPHGNITEIYSRKPQPMPPPQRQMMPNEVHYHQRHPSQKQYVPQQCYYGNVHPIPRPQMPVPPQEYVYDPRIQQYCPLATASQHDTNYDSAAYRSAHHELINQPRSYQEVIAPPIQKPPIVKRYPITVGTPKLRRTWTAMRWIYQREQSYTVHGEDPHSAQQSRSFHSYLSTTEFTSTQKRHSASVPSISRYYRKPPTNAVFKRPSALCLPVASQPDPAVYKRPRRAVGTDTQFGYQPVLPVPQQQDIVLQHQQIAQQQARSTHQEISYVSDIPSSHRLKKRDSGLVHHKIDSGGDVNMKIVDLDDMLESFEKDTDTPKVKSKTDIVKFARYLKPRVPASIKARQERMQRIKTMKLAQTSAEKCAMGDADVKNSSQVDGQDVTADSLEKLLNQLKKCELVVGKDPLDKTRLEEVMRTQSDDRHESNTEKPDVTDEEIKKQFSSEKSQYKSFNYQDITNQMLRSQNESKSYGDSAEESTIQSSIQDITKRLTSSLSDSTPHRPKLFSPKPPLDDHCALELHRSKSYIVNLIDRALSKELGTIPSERRKEFDNMNPRKAINMVNRHTGLCEKELCLEITSALTDSIISSATAPESQPSSSKSKICCCNGEEPTYIKQLKQLRWGHLKHIQREVRRLEDLERFLDACSLNTISEL